MDGFNRKKNKYEMGGRERERERERELSLLCVVAAAPAAADIRAGAGDGGVSWCCLFACSFLSRIRQMLTTQLTTT